MRRNKPITFILFALNLKQMKTFILDIIPKVLKYSKALDFKTQLENHHWVLIDGIQTDKLVYIFRPNNQLIISKNGNVKKGNWESLGNNSILIEYREVSLLLRQGFYTPEILALKLDSKNEFVIFVNETIYGKEINNLDDVVAYLKSKEPPKDKPKLIINPETKKPIYFYIDKKGEHGPISLLKLKELIVNDPISKNYFVRNNTETSYYKRKRIGMLLSRIEWYK